MQSRPTSPVDDIEDVQPAINPNVSAQPKARNLSQPRQTTTQLFSMNHDGQSTYNLRTSQLVEPVGRILTNNNNPFYDSDSGEEAPSTDKAPRPVSKKVVNPPNDVSDDKSRRTLGNQLQNKGNIFRQSKSASEPGPSRKAIRQNPNLQHTSSDEDDSEVL